MKADLEEGKRTSITFRKRWQGTVPVFSFANCNWYMFFLGWKLDGGHLLWFVGYTTVLYLQTIRFGYYPSWWFHTGFVYYQVFGKMLRCIFMFFNVTCMHIDRLKRLKSQAIWAKAEASWFCFCIRYAGMPRHIPECMNFKHMFSKQYSYTYVWFSLN